MSKNVTVFSKFKAPQGFWIYETVKNAEGDKIETKRKVQILPGKQEIPTSDFEALKTQDVFKAVLGDGIMVHSEREEAKAQKHDEKLLKEIEELRGKLKSQDAKDQEIASLKKQISHLTQNQKAKPGPKPQGK